MANNRGGRGRTPKNIAIWEAIEDLPMFQPGSDVETEAWTHLEKLQSERLTAVDLFAIKRLLELAYDLGKRFGE